jgi:hypothetical protein
LLYGEEPITPKEIKFRSARTRPEAIHSPMEAESKDLIEPERMKAYQDEMMASRDKKVKEKTIEVGDLVLLQSPHTKAFETLEPKFVGPYLITEKTRLGSFHLVDTEGKMLQHSWNGDNLCRFYI